MRHPHAALQRRFDGFPRLTLPFSARESEAVPASQEKLAGAMRDCRDGLRTV